MAKSPPAFQFYAADFVMGTAYLDAESTGCYVLLLCHQWLHGFVPSDRETLSRICRTNPKRFPAIWSALSDKFVECEGGYVNLRMEEVRKSKKETSAKRAAARSKRLASDAAS